MMEPFWQIIGTALTGGTLGALLTFLISKQKENRNNFNTIIETWAADNARLRESEELLRQRIIALETQLIELKEKLMLLEAVQKAVVTENLTKKK